VCYRIAGAGDVSVLSRFYGYERFVEGIDPAEAYARQLESLDGYGLTLVADLAGRVVGAAVVRRFPPDVSLYPDWWLFGMLVSDYFRGAGIGQGLVDTALRMAVGEGALRVSLLVFEENQAAIALYRKMGFGVVQLCGLSEQLESEARQSGYRRIIMSRSVEHLS
jgi:ribosomal protein S18 acetylase RimI-like enzyme